jgi:hypothetical protein
MEVESAGQQYQIPSSAFDSAPGPTDGGGSLPPPASFFGSAPPGAAPAGSAPDGMSWTGTDAAAAAAAQPNTLMQVDAAVAPTDAGQAASAPLAAGAPLLRTMRNPREGPLQKLTAELIKTYRHINYVRSVCFAWCLFTRFL